MASTSRQFCDTVSPNTAAQCAAQCVRTLGCGHWQFKPVAENSGGGHGRCCLQREGLPQGALK